MSFRSGHSVVKRPADETGLKECFVKLVSQELLHIFPQTDLGVIVKFIYSEKATKFCEIFPLLLTTVHTVKSNVKISQNFVAFSEYMNFTMTNQKY